MVLHTFAAHYCAIWGAIKVPSLGDANLLNNQAYGALAMSAAAVSLLSRTGPHDPPPGNCLGFH
jgi:hypothetical protein